MKNRGLAQKLAEKNLKVTPQRIAVLEAVNALKNHPTAEAIITSVRERNSNISVATVYKVLEVLVESGLIRKVKTEKDVMRYDGITVPHHHIYSSDSEKIEDYFDDELNDLLNCYFKNKKLPGFHIEEIKLHIVGKYGNGKEM